MVVTAADVIQQVDSKFEASLVVSCVLLGCCNCMLVGIWKNLPEERHDDDVIVNPYPDNQDKQSDSLKYSTCWSRA